jgi:hypothetical protein
MNHAAATAAVLGTADAQDAQACRHEVEHLADVLTDRMERTTAAGTDMPIDVECDVLARQIVGKRLSPRRGFKISIVDRDGRMRLSSCDIGVEIFEPEHKLVTAEPFRSPAELCAL